MTGRPVAVLGAGVVGVNLARRFADLGHDVVFGARDASSPKVLAALATVPGATVATIPDAVADTELAVLAVPFGALDAVLSAIGDPGSTILVDATNTVGESLPEDIESIPDLIHRMRPGAVVVKAFNTIGAEAFLHPQVGDQRYFLPIAGPAEPAEVVRRLASDMGFDAMVIGDLSSASLLESHARLWIHLAFRTGLGRDFGFVRVDHSVTG